MCRLEKYSSILPEHLRKAPYEDLDQYVKQEFDSLYQAGGEVNYFPKDWNDPTNITHGYDIILNQNGLRRANSVETKKAARSFWRILKPGGLLITTTINALERRDEIVPKLEEAGFNMVPAYLSEEEEGRIHTLNPLKKHAVYCEITG